MRKLKTLFAVAAVAIMAVCTVPAQGAVFDTNTVVQPR